MGVADPGSGEPWEWRTLGVVYPGTGELWEWRTLGLVYPGTGEPWEWRTLGVASRHPIHSPFHPGIYSSIYPYICQLVQCPFTHTSPHTPIHIHSPIYPSIHPLSHPSVYLYFHVSPIYTPAFLFRSCYRVLLLNKSHFRHKNKGVQFVSMREIPSPLVPRFVQR